MAVALVMGGVMAAVITILSIVSGSASWAFWMRAWAMEFLISLRVAWLITLIASRWQARVSG